MADIRAFVGHSFEEGDDAIVRVFLDYFGEIQNMGPGFTWDHAKDAETKDLAEKVLGKIQDKNLFIAICTKKELVARGAALSRSVLPWGHLAAAKDKFEWKTSDWIIQEIGLALGRSMNLMILLEEGVRRPGGLQGNHEYITFHRSRPEKSFTQILQTIRSLSPTTLAPFAESMESDVRQERAEKVDTTAEPDFFEPQEAWSRDMYRFAFTHMIAEGDEEGADRIDKSYLACADAQRPGAQESWEAAKELRRLRYGKGGKLSNLEALVKFHEENSEVRKCLAIAYREHYQYVRASEQFVLTAEKASSVPEKLGLYGDAILALVQGGEKEKIKRLVSIAKELAHSFDGGEVRLIEILKRVAKKWENAEAMFGLNERLLDITPDDADSRFDLAYAYAAAKLEDVSLLHYLRIHHPDSAGTSWNNLGVQLDYFGLVGKAVEAFREAEKAGNTLAMGNIAFKFINAGFFKEAEDICNAAMKHENCDKRVNLALTRLKELPDEESKRGDEIVGEARALSEFFRDFGQAFVQPELPDQEGLWKGSQCDLKTSIRGGVFHAVGEYEIEDAGLRLLGAMAGLRSGAAMPTMKRYRIVYEGSVEGYAIKATVRREEIGGRAAMQTLLGSEFENPVTALLAISKSKTRVAVFERTSGNQQLFYSLEVIQGS